MPQRSLVKIGMVHTQILRKCIRSFQSTWKYQTKMAIIKMRYAEIVLNLVEASIEFGDEATSKNSFIDPSKSGHEQK